MVWRLTTCTIDDPGHLVGHHELKVLCCQGIADEKAILDLDRSEDFVTKAILRHRPRASRMELMQ